MTTAADRPSDTVAPAAKDRHGDISPPQTPFPVKPFDTPDRFTASPTGDSASSRPVSSSSVSKTPKSMEELFLDLQQRLMNQIDARFASERAPAPTPDPSASPDLASGPRVFVGVHPRSSHPPSQSDSVTGDDDSLRAELHTVLPPSPPLAEVTVKSEPDSDIEIISTPPSTPPRPSRIAEAAAEIDQATCRLHLLQACQMLGKKPGELPNLAQEASDAAALSSTQLFRDHGMVPSPDVKVAWPHDESLDRTQEHYTAALQQREGSQPARDLFSLPPPAKGADKFLPLPSRRVPRDQWYYMTQTAHAPSWSAKAPLGSQLARSHPAPESYTLPHGQFIAQEANLRHMSHLATMTDTAATAVCRLIFTLFDRGLWPDEPITLPGVDEPVTFPWIISMFRLMGVATSQIAHNAVCAAMNMQLARRDTFLRDANYKTGISAADRELIRMAPMNSPDLFGTQASDLKERKEMYQRDRPQRQADTIARLTGTPTAAATPAQASSSRSSSSSSRNRSRNRSRPSASASRPPQAPEQPPATQPFRSNAGRGRGSGSGQQSNKNKNTPKKGGGAGRGHGRQ